MLKRTYDEVGQGSWKDWSLYQFQFQLVSSFHRFIMATTNDNIFSMIEKEARKKNCSFTIGRSHIVKLKAIFKEAFGKVFIKRIIFNF